MKETASKVTTRIKKLKSDEIREFAAMEMFH